MHLVARSLCSTQMRFSGIRSRVCKACASRVQIEGKSGVSQKMITIEERTRRADAVRRGFANVELEGFIIPHEVKEQAARFVAGEILLEEFLADEVK